MCAHFWRRLFLTCCTHMHSIFVLYVCMKYKFLYVIRIGLPNCSLANLNSLISLSSYITPRRPNNSFYIFMNAQHCSLLPERKYNKLKFWSKSQKRNIEMICGESTTYTSEICPNMSTSFNNSIRKIVKTIREKGMGIAASCGRIIIDNTIVNSQ